METSDMRTSGSARRIIFLLILSLTVFLLPGPSAYASEVITLGSDGWSQPVGTWDPVERTGTLTQDVSAEIRIIQNDITLDGGGHVVQGDGTGRGVLVEDRFYVTVRNLTVQDAEFGVLVRNSAFCVVESVQASGGMRGIYLYQTTECRVIDCHSFDNQYGFTIRAFSRYNRITGCEANHNTLIGISLEGPFDSIVSDNWIHDNGQIGLVITDDWGMLNAQFVRFVADWNIVYRNVFESNPTHAAVSLLAGLENDFFLPAPDGGNYWSGHDPTDSDGDGFADSPYIFYGGQDLLPWSVPGGWNEPPGLLDVFDRTVADGTLTGNGSRDKLEAFRDRLVEVMAKIDEGWTQAAIRSLEALCAQCDGNARPKDLVSGEARADLYAKLIDLLESLRA